jgi:hypothetical protein
LPTRSPSCAVIREALRVVAGDAWRHADALATTRSGAYFEALLVHARNLIEFFAVGPVKHDDALTPGDFGVANHNNYDDARERFQDGVGDVDEMYSMICTFVSHLSKARDFEPPYWPLQPLVETLVDETERFTAAAALIGHDLPLTRAAIAACRAS